MSGSSSPIFSKMARARRFPTPLEGENLVDQIKGGACKVEGVNLMGSLALDASETEGSCVFPHCWTANGSLTLVVTGVDHEHKSTLVVGGL